MCGSEASFEPQNDKIEAPVKRPRKKVSVAREESPKPRSRKSVWTPPPVVEDDYEPPFC